MKEDHLADRFLLYKTGGSWKVQLESCSLHQKSVWRTLKANTFVLELGVADTEAESKEAAKRRTALEGCKTQKTNKLRNPTPSLSLFSQLSNFAQPAKVVADTWRARERAGKQAPAGSRTPRKTSGWFGRPIFSRGSFGGSRTPAASVWGKERSSRASCAAGRTTRAPE